ncbi:MULTISPECIES: YncE family protein [unclassified Fibrobacter]|uniref:YncE family protein n=1 Tax=unclassified Fibrobacter TaxID=2634177 RepID=UPI000D6AB273|nr:MULTISPECIES: hypothetical protein [unclassified Fibrobacter]PWJ68153.1 hypothetical protein BGX12_11080 [Fibrobacter sp. UWR4]PZW71888.1 hypothetical protein C8E88_100981 [Fibrobacter sp. UWR1]
MKNKYLALLAASSFAFFMQACDHNSIAAGEPGFDKDDDKSSSSVKGDDKSSSSSASEESESLASLYVVGSDYKTGEIRWVENDSISAKSLEIYQDTKLVTVGDKLFALERSGSDNVALINTADHKVVWETALSDYSNPTDIVAAGKNEAWVALEGTDSFVKISMENGKVLKTVKTTDFVSEGGYSPNLVDFEVSGDTLFAVFQRYVSNFDADGNWTGTSYPKGLLALYGLKDGELLDTIQLAKKNPSAVAVVKGEVYVASMGEYNASYGTDADDERGIEKVNLSKKSSELYVSGKKIGAGVYNFAVDYKAGVAYAVAYKGMDMTTYATEAPVMKIDLAAGSAEAIKGIADAEGGLVVDAATGVLYVGDRTYGEEAVYSYDGKKVAKVASAAEKALAPYSLAVVK